MDVCVREVFVYLLVCGAWGGGRGAGRGGIRMKIRASKVNIWLGGRRATAVVATITKDMGSSQFRYYVRYVYGIEAGRLVGLR